jgi:molybdopterin-guanine dinucleotide biosynthesis adapter protein
MTSSAGTTAAPTDSSGNSPRAIAIVGFANTGKTELICGLLPVLAARGLKIAVLKHSHHADLDRGEEGKDTWRYRRAGAQAVAIAAPGLVQVTRVFAGEPPLEQALAALGGGVDLILVEGYKKGPLPKVAVLGPQDGRTALDYPHLLALVSEGPVDTPLPVFQPHQVEELGSWLHDYLSRD